MTLFIPIETLKNYKNSDKLPFKCKQCEKIFYKKKNFVQCVIAGVYPTTHGEYCSLRCLGASFKKRRVCSCKQCGEAFERKISEISKNTYCSSSCAAIYNNAHKTTGTRRSKLECWIESQLSQLYPNLEIHFNRRDAINGELDIYIPSLKLAFELNGIFHYEPIFTEEKLKGVQSNDLRKFQACIEHGIELCIIDTSKQEYFKEKSSKMYLDIITKIINASEIGIEPIQGISKIPVRPLHHSDIL